MISLFLKVSETVSTPVMTSMSGVGTGTPQTQLKTISDEGIQQVSATYVSTRPTELISSISSGCNLQILYRYTRSINLFSISMVTIELTFVNHGIEDLTEVKITNKVSLTRIVANNLKHFYLNFPNNCNLEHTHGHLNARIFYYRLYSSGF